MAGVNTEDHPEKSRARPHRALDLRRRNAVLWRRKILQGRFQLVDSRFKGKRRDYVRQTALATGALVLILLAQDLLTNAAIFAALASTAFVLFLMPHSITATPRHAVGGHVVSASIGVLFSLIIAGTEGTGYEIAHGFGSDVLAAVAVGVAMLAMALSDTEHAPAAGSALGFAITDFDWVLYIALITSVVGMTLIQQFMMPRLREIL